MTELERAMRIKFNNHQKTYHRKPENLSQRRIITSYRVGEGNEDSVLVAISLKPEEHQ